MTKFNFLQYYLTSLASSADNSCNKSIQLKLIFSEKNFAM